MRTKGVRIRDWVPAAGLGIGLAMPGAAAAQGWPAWRVEQAQGVPIATSSGGLGLMCAEGAPVLALNLQPPAASNPARVRVRVDGFDHQIDVAPAGGTMWAAIADNALIDALGTGRVAEFHIDGALRAALPLAGARAAIAEALAGCYAAGTGELVQAPDPGPADALARALIAGDSREIAECRADGGSFVPLRPEHVVRADFNGDRILDLLVEGGEAGCFQGAGNGNCGSHGCGRDFHISSPDGFRRETIVAYDALLVPASPLPIVRFGTADGPVDWVWDGQQMAPMAGVAPSISAAAKRAEVAEHGPGGGA